MNDLNLSEAQAAYVETEIRDGVAMIIMNRPDKLNGWTMEMMDAFQTAMVEADAHEDVKAIVLSGMGKYYSAGVNLAGTIQIMPPRKLHELIVEHNQSLFEFFLNCQKPLLVAINGHAIGASVTSATLSNHVMAAKSATFSTPFAALGIVPEGCSSVHFERLMGEDSAQRMLGEEGWKPTADEALEAGLIQSVAADDELHEKAFAMAKSWVEQGVTREFLGGSEREELLEVNAQESVALADAFLGAPFMKEQGRFLWSKKKRIPAATFFALWASRPVWSKFL